MIACIGNHFSQTLVIRMQQIRLSASLAVFLFCLIFQTKLEATTYKSNRPTQLKGFIRNVGQFDESVKDQALKILYKLPGQDVDIFITNTGLSYLFKENLQPDIRNEAHPSPVIKWSRIDLDFKEARISASNMVREEMVNSRLVYYREDSRGGTMIADLSRKIRFSDVYPGIDWVIYLQNNQVKYDFEVKPGSDPSLIQMHYRGDVHLKGNENNKMLELKNSLGILKEGELLCHDTSGNPVDCGYAIDGKKVRIVTSGMPAQGKLIIDPPLVWSTFAGGAADEIATTIASDASGNIIVSGYTNSANFPLTSGVFQGTLAGNNDVFVSKFSNTGALLWSTYFGGSANDNGFDVQIDEQGEILLVGSTASSNLPVDAGTQGGYFQQNYGGGNTDAFVAKFSASGSRLWATYYGGNNTDSGNSLAIDPQGNIYFTGATWSTGFPVQNPGGNAFYDGTVASTFSDAYLVKLSPTGSRVWATYYGGNNGDAGICLTTDLQGNVFVAGNTWSTDFNTLDAGSGAYYQPALAGGLDVFVLKFAPDASLKWATYYGGVSGDSRASSIACDSRGKVYVVGRTGSANFPVTDPGSGAYFHDQLGGNIWTTPYVMRFDNNGKTEWSTYLNGDGTGWTYDVEIGNNDQVFITGETRAPDFITLDRGNGSYFQAVNQGNMKYDAFIMEFDPTSKLKWSTLLGGSGDDYGQCLAIDPYNNLFVAGYAKSADFPVINAGGNSYFSNTLSGGAQDMYITKFGSNTIVLPEAEFSQIIACSGDTTWFTDMSTGNPSGWEWNFGDPASAQLNTSADQNPWHIYNSGGTFNVQLKVSNVFGTDSLIKQVQVVQTVQGAITGLDTVYCNNHPSVLMTGSPAGGIFSGNGVSDNIFLPKEALPGMNLITYTPPSGTCVIPAEVWVRVKSDETCETGLFDFYSGRQGPLRVYPNPFGSMVQISAQIPYPINARFSLKGLRGEEIWSGQGKLIPGINEMPFGGIVFLSPGMYFLQADTEEGLFSVPLIKTGN
jgi:PKD repeat protein